MKLRYMFSALLASCTLLVSAQTSDPMYMVLNMRDGQHKAVNVEEVNRLTFPNGSMKVEKKNATVENFVLNEIYSMEFSNNETGGIQNTKVVGLNVLFNHELSTILFDGIAGQTFALYNLNGTLMLSFVTPEGRQTLDVSSLPNGTYIISYKGQSFKFVK